MTLFRFLALWLFCAALSEVGLQAREWPHERSDVAPHPDVVWGELENGFRYAVLPHRAKPGRVSLRFVVEAGSLDEAEDERGFAHFVEHMAFEGTDEFSAEEMVHLFEGLGMGHGEDVNAFTYHEKTVYHLELLSGDVESLKEAMRLYRGYADGIQFDAKRLERERSVILRERSARDTPSARAAQASFDFSFRGTRLTERHPIGQSDAVQSASVAALQRFYRKWYRPDLMTLVVVGDVDAAAVPALASEAFGDLQRPDNPVLRRDVGTLNHSEPFRSGALKVSGASRHTVEIVRAWDDGSTQDTWQRRELDAMRGLVAALLNERLSQLIDGVSQDFAHYDRVHGFPYCQLSISSDQQRTWDVLVWLDHLIRQASLYGFSEDEIDLVRKIRIQSGDSISQMLAHADPRAIVDDLVEAIVGGFVYSDPVADHLRIAQYLQRRPAAAFAATFRETWALDELAYFVTGDFERPVDHQALRERLRDGRKGFLLPFETREVVPFAYRDFGTPGKLAESEELELDGIVVHRFENNVRLIHHRTSHEPERVYLMARVGGGLLEFESENPAVHALALTSLFRSGFRDVSWEELSREIRTQCDAFHFDLQDHDAFNVTSSGRASQIESMLSLMAEYISGAKVDAAAFAAARHQLRESMKMEIDGIELGYAELSRFLFRDHPQFVSPTDKEIETVSLQEIRDWLLPAFGQGYLEVVVVGDVAAEQLLPLFAKTFGALPPRPASKPQYAAARAVDLQPATGNKEILYPTGMGDNAAVVVAWTLRDELDIRERAGMRVLAAVLKNRILKRIRERMGASYAPSVTYESFLAYDRLRHLRIDIDCLPSEAERLRDVVLEICEGFPNKPVSEAELRAVIVPMQADAAESWTDNYFLLRNVSSSVVEYPYVVNNILRHREGLLGSISRVEVDALAARFLRPEKALATVIKKRIGRFDDQ